MKITPLLSILGLALSVACGGSEDGVGEDAGIDDIAETTGGKTGQPDGTSDVTAPQPKTGQPDGTSDLVAPRVTKVGQPDGVDERQVEAANAVHDGDEAGRYTYVLHGADADIGLWLEASDIVKERSEAGGLTYAVVLTTQPRDVPAALQP